MGFWGWPLAEKDEIKRACLAALGITRDFESASRQPGHPLADFRVGIGLTTGRAVAGRIGTTDQVKVTVFGPLVNRASRLEGMTKIVQTPILMDEATAQYVLQNVPRTVARCRRIAVVRPYGMTTPVTVSELLPPLADFPGLTDEHLDYYDQALQEFLAGHWTEAIELLHNLPAKDRVKDFLTVYIVEHDRTPPPGWDGIIQLTTKG
jgi:adenylate cyclase